MSKGNHNSNWPTAQQPNITHGEMSQYLNKFDEILNLPPCKKNDAEGVRKRIIEMFEYCEKEGRRPTVELLSAFMGVSRMALWKWQQDPQSEAGRLVERAKELINVLITEPLCAKDTIPGLGILPPPAKACSLIV